MDRRNSRKSQGRITINLEASDKIQALFSQKSDTSLVFSAAEHAANEKGETTDHATSTSTSKTNVTNTCVGVISLPKIVNTPPPPPNHGNEAEKENPGSGVKRSSPPPIKLPLLPTHQIRQPPKRIRSSLRRTPANANAEKPLRLPPAPLKPQLIPTQQFPQPERIRSSLRRTPANANAEKPLRLPPAPLKPQLIPTQQFPQPECIRSSVRRTLPSNSKATSSNAKKRSAPPPMKPPAPTTPPCQPERICSASLERKATFISPPTTNEVSGSLYM